MSNRIEWDGLTELRIFLRGLPNALVAEASAIVDATTDSAASAIVNAYPAGRTGELKRGITVSKSRGAFGVRNVIKSTTFYAWMWEHGTVDRHTRQGWDRGKENRSPPGRAFIPIMSAHRRAMRAQLIGLVKAKGFEVSETS